MSDPFYGEIRMFAGNYAPRGWALCDGQLLAVSQNSALFSLLGTLYGGDGQTTFALPDLRGRAPIHAGSGPGLTPRPLGWKGGAEKVTTATAELPSHGHPLKGTGIGASQREPAGAGFAQAVGQVYGDQFDAAPMHSSSIGQAGGSQPHDNMQPYLAVHFIIALSGIFPS